MTIPRWMMVATLAVVSPLASAQPPGPCPADCPMNCPHMERAAQGRGAGGWTSGPYARLYDPKTVETAKGEITQVDEAAPLHGMSAGVHITLKTDRGPMSVHLGPAWYLDHQDTQLAVGDRVDVRGSRVSVEGKPTLIAADVRKGNETLRLRDDQGLPLWRGWR
jgi:hypothetical protein